MSLQEIILKLRAYQTIIDAILSKLSVCVQDVYNSEDLEYISMILDHVAEMQSIVTSLRESYNQIQQDTNNQMMQIRQYLEDTKEGEDEDEETMEDSSVLNFTELSRSDIYSDFLFVPDKTKKSKWKLQVKVNGKPDIGLMGNAWAALHEGFMGNKVILPAGQKEKMIKKLVSLYYKIGKPTPAERDKGLTEKDIK
jgi:hypothetical protein